MWVNCFLSGLSSFKNSEGNFSVIEQGSCTHMLDI